MLKAYTRVVCENTFLPTKISHNHDDDLLRRRRRLLSAVDFKEGDDNGAKWENVVFTLNCEAMLFTKMSIAQPVGDEMRIYTRLSWQKRRCSASLCFAKHCLWFCIESTPCLKGLI